MRVNTGEDCLSHHDMLSLFELLVTNDDEREVIQRHFNLQLGLDTLPQFGFERKRITRDVLQRVLSMPDNPLVLAFGQQLMGRLTDCGAKIEHVGEPPVLP